MEIKKLGALLVSAALCAGMAAPAFAFEGEASPVEQPVLPEVVEDVVTITDETSGALTPEGNLTLVDDYHTSYSDGSGQQFITLVSKSGNTFYLVIDRNAKGQQTVHFMNLVDEADLLALMEEDAADAYQGGNEMRLNDNNTFIGINPPYQLSVIHSSKLIYPREIYQRGVERKRVELIARDFNEYIVNEPKVSFRNGRYYVMDGQHTIEGCILLNGGEDRPILCKVYTGLTMEQEALLFAEQNGHSAPLSAGIKLRAKVVGGDAPSKAFVAATNRVGLSLNYDSMQLSDYRISCVGTALKLYDQLGEEIYCEALRHIVAAWEGRPDSFRAAVLRGVMYFVQLYHGQYSAERLVRALGGVHPMELYRISRDNPAKLPGWRRYVYPIYTTYNGKCRKDALPMKF